MRHSLLIKTSGFCGVALPIFTVLFILRSMDRVIDFSWTENAISDLGRIGYGTSYFNFGLIIIGVLLLIFSIGLNLALKNQRIGPTVFAISAIYLIGVGIYPLPASEHADLSGLFFIAFIFGFLAFGIKNYKNQDDFLKKMGIFALIVVLFAAISPISFLFASGVAIPEAMVIFPGFIWCFVFGINMILSEF
ncbi:MAG: DUF998 domain-containing protein [Thermoplasmatales archaeon]|nr:DUF998 domain-containing protein [Thermoplasmatales archaeon]